MENAGLIWAILIAMGVPTSVTALGLWFIQNAMKKSEKKREEHERKKERCEILLIQSVSASISLGEACAIALRDGKTNGETKEALRYAQRVKNEQRDFLTELAAQHIIGT